MAAVAFFIRNMHAIAARIIFLLLFHISIELEAKKMASWRGPNRLISGDPPSPRALGQLITSFNTLLYVFGGRSLLGKIMRKY